MQGLYIIKSKRVICTLENNQHKISEENKAHIHLKTETNGYDIREVIDDNAIRKISVQIKALKGHEAILKESFTYALKEANDEKLPQK